MPAQDFHEVSQQKWQRDFDVKVNGTFHAIQSRATSHAGKKLWTYHQHGVTTGHGPAPRQGAHCASKAAIVATYFFPEKSDRGASA